MLNHHIFNDACRLAKVLDKRINCSWSLKRLILEHNEWSSILSNIVLSNEPEYSLNISNIYHDFAKWSGYKLLTTNIDILREGIVQNHCVVSYIDKVNRGDAAIFHIEGYTLEVNYVRCWDSVKSRMSSEKKFLLGQLRGFKNISAPSELMKVISDSVEGFSQIVVNNKNKYINSYDVSDVF